MKPPQQGCIAFAVSVIEVERLEKELLGVEFHSYALAMGA